MKRKILNVGIEVDLNELLESRLLIQASTGGGKSYMLRVLTEQALPHMPVILFDWEGEFVSLREKFDMVLAGAGGDVPCDVKSAAMLAQSLVRMQVSALIDLSELEAHRRLDYVRDFLTALIEKLPRKSWPSTNGKAFLVMIDEAHKLCMDDETEILTNRGWLRHDQVMLTDLAAAFDLNTGTARLEPIKQIIRKAHCGPMVSLKSDGIDSIVTPEHRVVLRREQRAKGRTKKLYPWTFVQARKLPTQFRIPAAAKLSGCGVSLTDDELRVLGWIITEGYLCSRGKSIRIDQAVTTTKRGYKIVDAMDIVFKRINCRGRYVRRSRTSTYRGKRVKHAKSISYYLGVKLSERFLSWLDGDIHRIPRDILTLADARQLEILYTAMLEGDGTAQKDGWTRFYAGHNERLADDFQELAIRLGVSASKKKVPQSSQWVIFITRRQHHYIRKATRQHYEGLVWCITVPSGAFVARRHGKAFITGNCPQKESSVARSAVIDLQSRGRKRGFGCILATQRLSKLDKDAAAECGTVFVGRCSQIDSARACDILGLPKKESHALTQLRRGEWRAVGTALEPGLHKFRGVKAKTTHAKSGVKLLTPPAPSKKIRGILPMLQAIQDQTVAELQTTADYKKELANVRRELTNERKGKAKPEIQTVDRVVGDPAAVEKAVRARDLIWERWVKAELHPILKRFYEMVSFINKKKPDILNVYPIKPNLLAIETAPALPAAARRTPRADPVSTAPAGDGDPHEAKILSAIAWYESVGIEQPARAIVGVMAGYKGGGRFNKLLGGLKGAGLIDYPGNGSICLTDAGRATVPPQDAPATLADLHRAWSKKLNAHEWKLVVAAMNNPGMTPAELASATNYSGGGRFNKLLASIRSLGLVTSRGPIEPTDLVYPEGLA